MRTIFFFLLATVIVTSCTQQTAHEKLHEIMQNYHEQTLKMNPIGATFQGDTRYNDYLPNYLDDEVIASQKAFYSETLKTLLSINSNDLNEQDKLSKKILQWECETTLMGMEFPSELLPIDQMWTLQLTMGQLAAGASAQPFTTVTDYTNWLSRVDDYVAWLKSAKTKMKEGIMQDVVLPKSLIRKVVPQLEAMTESDLDKNIFSTPCSKLKTQIIVSN